MVRLSVSPKRARHDERSSKDFNSNKQKEKGFLGFLFRWRDWRFESVQALASSTSMYHYYSISRLEAEKVNLITMFPTFRMIAKLVQRGKDRERESPKEKRDGEVKQRKVQLKMVLRVRGETSKPK